MAQDTTPKGGGKKDNDPINSALASIPMEHLIGAPFAAAIKAQKQLGHELITFVNMLAYGTETAEGNAGDKPILTLPMELERPVTKDDGSVDVNKITVKPPVLGLVPIPALLIESVDVTFSMEIHTVEKSSAKSSASVSSTAKAGGNWGLYSASVEVSGKASTQRESTRSTDKTAKYDVTVHAAQQEPTEGMAKLMDLLASTVEPIPSTSK